MALLQSWNVLCWNIRGLNADKKRLALSNAIQSSGCAIICLQETKLQKFDASTLKLLCPKRFDRYVYIPSVGVWGELAQSGIVLFSLVRSLLRSNLR